MFKVYTQRWHSTWEYTCPVLLQSFTQVLRKIIDKTYKFIIFFFHNVIEAN